MAISWGTAVCDSTNCFRIGYEFSQSPTSVSSGTASVTLTLKIYLGTKYNAWDSGVSWAISNGFSASGSTSFNHTSGTAWSSSNVTLLATRSKTVTTSYSSAITTTISASVTGLSAIAGTAYVSGSWTTAKRPYSPPAAPDSLSATRASDAQVNLAWSNNSSTGAPYDNIVVQRYDWAGGSYGTVATLAGSATSYNMTGHVANKKYSYRIYATNSAGASAYVYAGPVYTTPAAPTSVAAARSGNDIVVTWVDNSPYNDSVELWHSANGVRDASSMGLISSDVTTATHVAPATGVQHSYEVRSRVESGLYSAYSTASNQVKVNDDPPTAPTAVTPANAATVTVPNPTLGATLTAIATGQTQKAQWQFASNSGFTTDIKTITEADADLRASGATTEAPTLAALTLPNGTWYLRARAIDKNGVAGPWSATNTVTVNTPVPPTPTAVTPASGASVTTMTPTLGGTLGTDGAGRTQKMEWQLATNSGFTTNLRTITEGDADLRASGATTEVVPDASKIYGNGTWYIRGRAVAQDGAVSAWTAGTTFTLSMAAPPTPTAITPTAGSTVTTNTPTLGVTLGAATEGRRSKAEWQLATDSGFTANVKTITEADADLRLSGTTTEAIPTGSKLSQTTWYVRARAIDEYGQAGSWTGSQTLIVAHQPTATATSPTGDRTIAYGTNTTFSWTFSDPAPGDAQSAYQIIVERNDTGVVLYDSTKVTSSANSANVASASLLKDVKMRWKVIVWDADNVASAASPYQLFTLSDVPAPTITSPTEGQQLTTGQPTISWSNDAGTTQATYRVVITRTSDGATVLDSGTVSATVTTYTAPNTVLENSIAYAVTVYITDTAGLVGSDTNNFTTQYQSPDPVTYTVDASGYEDLGYINIDWATMPPDDFFVQWNVYRRLTGTLDWVLLAAYTDSTTTQHHDWTATAGDTWEYAVTQLAGRSGTVLESPLNGDPISSLASGTHYWLINPLDETENLQLDHVTSDSFSDSFEQAELIIIGRGRKMNLGTRFGYDGSLTAQLRDGVLSAREKRKALETIKRSLTSYYLRNPFGDLLEVSLADLQFSRVSGVGTAEYVDVTIPYKEVF